MLHFTTTYLALHAFYIKSSDEYFHLVKGLLPDMPCLDEMKCEEFPRYVWFDQRSSGPMYRVCSKDVPRGLDLEVIQWNKSVDELAHLHKIPFSIAFSKFLDQMGKRYFEEEDPTKNLISSQNQKKSMNHYHTAVVAYPDTDSELKKIVKSGKYEIIPYKVRIGSSEESVKMEMARELPQGTDIDDVEFQIQPIFE